MKTNKLINDLNDRKNSIDRILIIKLRGIGDVVLATSAIKNIKEYFVNAKIDLLTEKPSAELIKHTQFIDDILIFNRKSSLDRLKLAVEVRNKKYDMVIDFFSNPSTAQITFASGAKYRAGFPYSGRRYAYNIYGPEERGKYHAAELHLEFLKLLNIPIEHTDLEIQLSEEDVLFAQDFINNSGLQNNKILGISPSGGWQSKKCEPEKFAEFAEEITEHYDYKCLVVWGPGDKADADKIKDILGDKAVLAPDTTISQMAALLGRCDVVMANDSGPMHIATAIGTPVISLHGPTDPRLQGPFGNQHEFVRLDDLECIGCNLLECNRNHECFLELPKERVLKAFENILAKKHD